MAMAAFDLIRQELEKVFGQLSEQTVTGAMQAIQSHTRIFVCGAGRSGLMLKAFAMRLMQAGFCVFVAGETTTPAIGPGDLLIAASASGKTLGVCQNAKVAKACGADLWIISGTEHSPLAQIQKPDVLFNTPSKENAASTQVMGTLFEQALLIWSDGVVMQLAHDPAAMRSRHANLE